MSNLTEVLLYLAVASWEQNKFFGNLPSVKFVQLLKVTGLVNLCRLLIVFEFDEVTSKFSDTVSQLHVVFIGIKA